MGNCIGEQEKEEFRMVLRFLVQVSEWIGENLKAYLLEEISVPQEV